MSEASEPLLSVTVYGGKYTVIQDAGGGLRALRYGEEWRDCTGDGMVLALAQEVADAREEIEKLKAKNAHLEREMGSLEEAAATMGNYGS